MEKISPQGRPIDMHKDESTFVESFASYNNCPGTSIFTGSTTPAQGLKHIFYLECGNHHIITFYQYHFYSAEYLTILHYCNAVGSIPSFKLIVFYLTTESVTEFQLLNINQMCVPWCEKTIWEVILSSIRERDSLILITLFGKLLSIIVSKQINNTTKLFKKIKIYRIIK